MRPSGEKTKIDESFHYAWEGVKSAAKERNFRIQASIGLVAIILGFVFRISPVEWIVLLFCIGAVLGGECINTAIEDVIDLSVKTFKPQAKHAKDIAAAAVLLMSIASLVIGIIIFAPKILGIH